MNRQECDQALNLIRRDPSIGIGSGSIIDESYTDSELLTEVISIASTPNEALEIAQRVNRTGREIEIQRLTFKLERMNEILAELESYCGL